VEGICHDDNICFILLQFAGTHFSQGISIDQRTKLNMICQIPTSKFYTDIKQSARDSRLRTIRDALTYTEAQLYNGREAETEMGRNERLVKYGKSNNKDKLTLMIEVALPSELQNQNSPGHSANILQSNSSAGIVVQRWDLD
ncbi:hypothetical protein L9F63_019955, partial [Diploptera punctata]